MHLLCQLLLLLLLANFAVTFLRVFSNSKIVESKIEKKRERKKEKEIETKKTTTEIA